jgi:Pyruvate/2-oxoacid:ferredoxin oxidoreductase gamma subunit
MESQEALLEQSQLANKKERKMTDTKVIVDCATGESTIVPLTPEELEQREADRIAFEAEEAARLADEEAKEVLKSSANAKLAALGLTAEEIAAITA